MHAVGLRSRPGEALPAVLLTVAALLALGPRPVVLGLAWLAIVTPGLIAVDIAEHRLPDAVVLPGYPIVLGAVALDAVVRGSDGLAPLVAGVAYGLTLLVLHLSGGLGFGDVKLAPLLGALAAAALPGGAVLAVVLAFLAGGVLSIGVLIRHGAGARLAFGPPMLLGAWATVLLPGAA